MGFWLAAPGDAPRTDLIHRFDPRFWTVDFPRPMVAAATTPAPDALRIDAVFYTGADLCGVIWASADAYDHPLLAYATNRDYRGCTLSFAWASAGVLPLDDVNGPVLTIEGRDATGAAQTWYVRLWNYAVGTGAAAQVTLPFDTLQSGFGLPGTPVWPGDIDRMFVSLVPPGYGSGPGPLPVPVEGWATLTGLRCDGPGAPLAIGDAFLPETGLSAATGYDDAYNLTPARLLRQVDALGYRGFLDHYVGMSHWYRAAWDGPSGAYLAGPQVAGSPVNVASAAWHRDFLARAAALGLTPILSMSYELFDANAPAAWKQRAGDGSPAATGYTPPSTLLSPCSPPAMAWLRAGAVGFAGLAQAAGLPVHFQVGEPWWWVGPDRKPCVYDAATTAAYTAQTGGAVPPAVADVAVPLTPAQGAYFDWAGTQLAASTAALTAAVKAAAPAAKSYLLFFTPQVVNANAATLTRLNLPAAWAAPAFDVLQIEDYDFVTAGDEGGAAAAKALIDARLGYPITAQHYFAGFATQPGSAAQWARIAAAAEAAQAGGLAATFIWAMPQIARDGFTYSLTGGTVDAFDDVTFPLALGEGASVSPHFFTQIVTTASGWEQRNAQWADARLRFDAGPSVRSEDEIGVLIAFFRARRGPGAGFRFGDPTDCSSALMTGAPGPLDQAIGTGDGLTTSFSLTKSYGGGTPRRITRPRSGTVRVAVGGIEQTTGWSMGEAGTIAFTAAPAAGAAVTAGFLFDVPVRFEADALDVGLASFRAGRTLSVPLIEVREA